MALTAEQAAELNALLGNEDAPPARRLPLGTPQRPPVARAKAQTPKAEFLAVLAGPDAPPPGPEIREDKGFGGRLLTRAGIPTTTEGWKEHYIRGPLGVALSPFHALGEAVDTVAESLGRQRPVSPEWRTPGGTPSIGLGEMVEQAAGAIPLPLGPVMRGVRALVGGRRPPAVSPPPPLALPQFTGMRAGETPMGPTVEPFGPIGPSRDMGPLTLPRGARRYPTPEQQQGIVDRYSGVPTRDRPPPEGPPSVVAGGPRAPEGVPLRDPQGRPVSPEVSVAEPVRERERLRTLYKGRLEPRIDLEGRAPDVAPAAPDLPQGPAPDFTVGRGPKAGISPLTQPKRGYRPPPSDITGGPPPPAPPAGPTQPLTREQLRELYKGRDPERIDLTGAPPEALPDWFDPSRLPPRNEGPLPPPDWFDPSRRPPTPPRPGEGWQPPAPSGRPSADPGVFGIEMDKGGGPAPRPPAAPTPNPEVALRDYAAPGGTKVVQQIGDELVEWTKTDRNEWQGWVAGAHRKLTGESALNLAANPPPRVGPPTGPELAANDVVRQQVPAVPAVPLQIKSPASPPVAVPDGPGNPHYDQFVARIPKLGQEQSVERARSALASHTLSRDFGVPVDKTTPQYRGLKKFIDDYAGPPSEKLVTPPPLTTPPHEVLPVNPRALPVPPKRDVVGPLPRGTPPVFERLAGGEDQALIGGTQRAMPTGPSKAAVPQADLKAAGGLFGQERAAREAAQEGAQGGLEIGMRGRQQAAVNEWIMDQLGGTFGIALTRAKSPGSIQPAVVAKLKSLGIDPADAWNATHMEVPPPGVLDRLAELSVPRPALEAPKGPVLPPTPTSGPIADAIARRKAAEAKLDAVHQRINDEWNAGGNPEGSGRRPAPQGNLGTDPEWRAARRELSNAEAAERTARKAASKSPALEAPKPVEARQVDLAGEGSSARIRRALEGPVEPGSPAAMGGLTEQPRGVVMRPQDAGRSMNDIIMEQLGPEMEAILAKTGHRFDLPREVKARLREMDLDADMAIAVSKRRAGAPDRVGAEMAGRQQAAVQPPPPEPAAAPAPQTRLAEAQARRTAAWARLDEVQRAFDPEGGARQLGRDPEYRAARQALSDANEAVRQAQTLVHGSGKIKRVNPNAFQAKGDWETGVPNLSDPDDVFAVIQGAGKIKVGEDLAGELRGVPALFKNKNGQSLDRIAEGLIESYPHLGGGDRAAVKEQLLDTMTRYANLRRDKAARTAKEARAFDVKADIPGRQQAPGTPGPSAEDVNFRKAMDFFDSLGQDESGALKFENFAKTWKRFRERFPMEEAVRGSRPGSPVLSGIEQWNTTLSDWMGKLAQVDWWRGQKSGAIGFRKGGVRQVNPEALKDAEVTAYAEWQANGGTRAAEVQARRHFPAEIQSAMRVREQNIVAENLARRYFALEPIPETPGPYLPRMATDESRQAVKLGHGDLGAGASAQTSVKGFQQAREFPTYRAGEQAGLEYADPRNAILLREWEGIKLRATHRLFKWLEDRQGIFRSESAAMRHSPTGQPWRVEGAPGGTWWTATENEAKLLQQNLSPAGGQAFGSLVHYANATLRNPNLINPAPHVVKNMAFKELLAQGPVSMTRLAGDAVELFRKSDPKMLAEFNEAMPFASSGRTAGETLGRELHRGPLATIATKGFIEPAGLLNRPSQKVIFEWADPAMRYSLFKHYRRQGLDQFEAANHAWTDLIRYGTRSQVTDAWKTWPLNFFVPWRFGTFVSLVKQVRNHPVRAALVVGAADYLREANYRASGRWFHLPTDYTEKPLAALVQERDPAELAAVAATTALFGPGGEFGAKQISELLNLLTKKGHNFEADRVKNAFWGVSQLIGPGGAVDEARKGNWGNVAGGLLLGSHNAFTYEPRRLMRDLPESLFGIPLPGMQRAPAVREAERQQQVKRERFERIEQRRQERGRPPSIEDRLRSGGYIK